MLRDDSVIARMDYDLHLAMLQQEMLTALGGLVDEAAVAAEPPFAMDTLVALQAQLQLQSLSASDLFNKFAMVRCWMVPPAHDR